MMGFGSGLAGFAAGLNSGLNTGAKLGQMVEDYQLRKVREQGILEAQAMQAAKAPKVEDQGDMQNLSSRPQASRDPNAPEEAAGTSIMSLLNKNQPEQPLSEVPQQSRAQVENPMASGVRLSDPKRFVVGNQQFDDKAKANAAAQDQTPDVESFYGKTLVPRMKDKLMELGRVEEAKAWEKYAEDKKNQGHMKDWGKALGFAQSGNYMAAAEHLMKLYPDYDDGFELIEATPQKGDNGKEGFLMKVRDAEGNERTVFHDAETITEQGLSALSPIEMFQKRYSSQARAKELEAKEAADKRNDERNQLMRFGLTAMQQFGASGRQEARLKAQEASREDKQEHDIKRDEAKGKQRMDQLEKREQQRIDAEARKLANTIKKGDSPEKQYMAARAQVMKSQMSATMEKDEIDAEARSILERAKSYAAEQNPQASVTAGAANPFAGGPQPGKKPVIIGGQIKWIPK